MKNFDSPVLVDISDLAEGVYAASGYTPASTPSPTPGPDWSYELRFAGHNSGSHSEVFLTIKCIPKFYSSFKATISFNTGLLNGSQFVSQDSFSYAQPATIEPTANGVVISGTFPNPNAGMESFTYSFQATFSYNAPVNGKSEGSFEGYADQANPMDASAKEIVPNGYGTIDLSLVKR